MNVTKKFSLSLFLSAIAVQSYAQCGPVSAGVDRNSGNGSIAGSIGQVAFVPFAKTQILPGLQQPYAIITESAGDSSIKLFPNPAGASTTLVLPLETTDQASYEVFDASGKKFDSQPITSPNQFISLTEFSLGTYILLVRQRDKIIATFKLIKNKS